MPTLNLGREPVAIIGAVDAALIAVQQLALSMPAGVHAAIAVAIVVCGTLLARAGVTPVAQPSPPDAASRTDPAISDHSRR
jgi:hypothetical protein